MSKQIQSHCDSRCQYANPENTECDCECGGTNHGQGTDTRIWEIKNARLSVTRKAFRKYLNGIEKGSGTKLYRKNRAEFDKQYLIWKTPSSKEDPTLIDDAIKLNDSITTVHSAGNGSKSEITIIKDQEFDGDIYSHVRRSNGKTEYRINDKITTKSGIPVELGW